MEGTMVLLMHHRNIVQYHDVKMCDDDESEESMTRLQAQSETRWKFGSRCQHEHNYPLVMVTWKDSYYFFKLLSIAIEDETWKHNQLTNELQFCDLRVFLEMGRGVRLLLGVRINLPIIVVQVFNKVSSLSFLPLFTLRIDR